MSERGRVVLIFAIVGLIAGGAGFYFFNIYGPAQDLKNAQAEIGQWEERWQAVRDCLLGKTPGSAKTSEALAIREMAPDPWDRQKCTPLVSKLSRGTATDTGIRKVEQAWSDLDKVASKAAFAFAKHVQSSTTLVDDPLPAALDALEVSRGKLRAAAELPAAAHTGTVLPAAQIVPLVDGEDKVTSLVIDSIPSAHGLILFGKTPNRLVQLTLTAGGAPKTNRVGPSSIRAVPDTSWGATPKDGEVHAGTFDVEGAMAAPTSLKIAEPRPTIAAVIGSLADGAVVFGGLNELQIARAKGGTITADPPIKITSAMAAVDTDGRAVILSKGANRPYEARFLGPGADATPLELPDVPYNPPCFTRDRVWAQSPGEVFAFGGGRPLFRKETDVVTLQGCTGEAAMFRGRGSVLICGDDCSSVKLPSGAPENAATTVVYGKLVAIASHGGVLGVWREGAKPVFYSLAEMANPVLSHEWPAMALTDGKVIDVIARGAKTFVIIRIPVP